VGKSTMLNYILGEKISITSPKPQTTRNRILGIRNDNNSQMIFIDTPGIHRGDKKLNKFMQKIAHTAKEDADILVLMIEADNNRDKSIHELDAEIIKGLSPSNTPVILLINKIDQISKPDLLPLIERAQTLFNFTTIIPISATTGSGIDVFLSESYKLLPKSPPFFPEDSITDASERFIAGETIREKIFGMARQEIPYSVAVVVEEFKEDENKGILVIRATIYAEKESQKKILVGKGGEFIKRVGTLARKDLEGFFEIKIFLDLRVKLLKDWTKNEESLKRLGYR